MLQPVLANSAQILLYFLFLHAQRTQSLGLKAIRVCWTSVSMLTDKFKLKLHTMTEYHHHYGLPQPSKLTQACVTRRAHLWILCVASACPTCNRLISQTLQSPSGPWLPLQLPLPLGVRSPWRCARLSCSCLPAATAHPLLHISETYNQ